ncbi:MAG TPA: GNAT family N-acetyltransferase [Candidatus Baltobacteraceae bacterium]|nr:GNAT family N-acetyltransferase [Candidatus Baltobacteraceae bacterium]
MRPVRIERAGAQNCAEIEPLFSAYRSFYRLAPDPQRALLYLSERLEHGESVLFLARSERRAVGFTQLYPSFSSLGMRAAWILNDLFVVPEARQMGIARMLVARAEGFAQESGAGSIWLQTGIENLAAQHLYESAGYERDVAFYRYDKALVTQPASPA